GPDEFLAGPARRGEAAAQLDQILLRNLHPERADHRVLDRCGRCLVRGRNSHKGLLTLVDYLVRVALRLRDCARRSPWSIPWARRAWPATGRCHRPESTLATSLERWPTCERSRT